MTTLLELERPRAPLPLFDRGLVPWVFEGGTVLGLVTRMELLTHLRRPLP